MRVLEQFDTWQGTGRLTGCWQHFVRLAGCSVPCPIRSTCDEQGALDHDAGVETSINTLAKNVFNAVPEWIHWTGGEPLHQLDEIQGVVNQVRASAPHKRNHLQTSGGVYLGGGSFDWITVSPKSTRFEHFAADEIVVVNATWVDQKVLSHIRDVWGQYARCKYFYLQPAETHGEFNFQETMELALSSNWDLTQQAHKWWGYK